MRNLMLAAAAGVFATFGALAGPTELGEQSWRLSGGIAHRNLEIFLVHARPAAGAVDRGPAPMALGEALAKGLARVHEAGDVERLLVENLSADTPIYIESGDIVKGAKQDRLLTGDLILQPKSGPVPIVSFCMEHGAWRPRAAEEAGRADRPRAAKAEQPQRDGAFEVAAAAVRANPPLAKDGTPRREVVRYVTALGTAIDGHEDVVGLAYAVNGVLTGAEIYGSPQLFAKHWLRLLEGAAIAAVAAGGESAAAQPVPIEAVARFLADAETVGAGLAPDAAPDGPANQPVRAAMSELDRMHRSYPAK